MVVIHSNSWAFPSLVAVAFQKAVAFRSGEKSHTGRPGLAGNLAELKTMCDHVIPANVCVITADALLKRPVLPCSWERERQSQRQR